MERDLIGQRLPRVDGVAKVTGQATYGADVILPGMLYGKVLRSPYPHARIKKIDYSLALTLDGVKAVVTAADFPPLTTPLITGPGEMTLNLSHLRKSFLAEDKVLFHGHAVAAVAATSPYIAEEALELIRVEYEPLPMVEDPVEAMKAGAPLLHPDLYPQTMGERSARPGNVAAILEMGRGNVEEGFKQADVVLENTFHTQMLHQGYLEPQAAAAQETADGRLTIWTTTQGPFTVRTEIAAIFSLPLHRVKVIPMEVGGGFGAKMHPLVETYCVLLAKKTGRPVKVVLTREESLRATNPGSPSHITIKTGAKKDGQLTAISAQLVFDAGAFPGAPVAGAALSGFAPYKVPHLKIQGYDVVTNKPRVGAMRAPGATQGAFAVESQMDVMAEALGLDPLKFRQINAVEEGDLMPIDRPFNRVGYKQLLERVARHPAWTTPLKGDHRGRGLAAGFWRGAVLTSDAQIMLQEDGSLSVTVGTVDLTGTKTALVQIAAQVLGVEPERIAIRTGDTDSIGYSDVTGGSRTTYSTGTAVYQASQELLAQLLEAAGHHFGVAQAEYEGGRFFPSGSPEKGLPFSELVKAVFLRHGPFVGRGTTTRLQPAPAFGVHVADVEVDPETGQVKILKYTAFQDVGRAINPALIEAQVQGAVAMGAGWALSEQYVFDKGVLLNTSFTDYRQPTAADLPSIGVELVEVPAPDGPLGVRGVGEVPVVPPPAALANAVSRAMGVRIKKLPMTPEALYWALKKE